MGGREVVRCPAGSLGEIYEQREKGASQEIWVVERVREVGVRSCSHSGVDGPAEFLLTACDGEAWVSWVMLLVISGRTWRSLVQRLLASPRTAVFRLKSEVHLRHNPCTAQRLDRAQASSQAPGSHMTGGDL